MREAHHVDERAPGQPRDRARGRAQQHGEMLRRRLQHSFLRPLATERATGVPELAQRDVAEAALAHALAELPVEDVEARPARTGLAVVGEGDRGVLAGPLRRDQGEVGLADELLLRARVDREGRDARGQGGPDEVLGGGAPDSVGELDPRGGLAVDDHGELVAADAERLLAGAALLGQRARELPQDAVARRVALVVVQALEVVEVAEEQRDLARSRVGAQESAVEVLLEGAMVAELGQRVAARLGVREREAASVGERRAGELGRRDEEARMDADLCSGRDADEQHAEGLAAGRDRSGEGVAARGAVPGQLRQLARAGRDETPLFETARDDARRAGRLPREEAERGGLERRPAGTEEVDRGRPAAGDLADVAREELRDRRAVCRQRQLAGEAERTRGLREQSLGRLRGDRRRLVPPTLHLEASSLGRSSHPLGQLRPGTREPSSPGRGSRRIDAWTSRRARSTRGRSRTRRPGP